MVVGALKRIFGGKPSWGGDEAVDPLAGVPGEADFDFDGVIAQLELARSRAAQVYYGVMDEIGKLNDQLYRAVKERDRDAAEVAAAELVVKKRVAKALLAYLKLLDIAIGRIKHTRSLTELSKTFASIVVLLRSFDSYMYDNPELSTVFAQFASTAESIISHTGLATKSMPLPRSVAELDPEIRQTLAMVWQEANKETENLLPSVPESVAVDYAVLESRLLEHIKANGGVLNVKKAAEELGVSPRMVKEVLYRLEKKGVIRITQKTQAGGALHA